MTARTEIYTDGSFNDQTGIGGWSAVAVRMSAGRQIGASSYEMELRALVEAVRMADGPCTVVSDYHGIVRDAQEGTIPAICKAVWRELYEAMAGKDIAFEWRRRAGGIGQRLAHQTARDAARGL